MSRTYPVRRGRRGLPPGVVTVPPKGPDAVPDPQGVLTLAQVREGIAAGHFTTVDVVRQYLDRIREIDSTYRAWVHVDEAGALMAARSCDEALDGGSTPPALLGTVVGVKDLFYVEGMPLRAGSSQLDGFTPSRDATVVRRLRSAGAIVLGITASTAWAGSDQPATRNAWDPQRTPGGSSSGSAVAVANRTCAAALGTQTAGSILRPAAYNGVVGVKPSLGRVSRWGVVPDSWSIACPGFITRCVQDASLLLAAADGFDPLDGSTDRWQTARGCREGALGDRRSSWRVGVPARLLADGVVAADVRERLQRVLGTIEHENVVLEPFTLPREWDAAVAAHWIVMHCEVAANHMYLHSRKPAEYEPHIRSLVEVGQTIPATTYLAALKLRTRFRAELRRRFTGLDVVIAPVASDTAPPLARQDGAPNNDSAPQTGDHGLQMPWTFAGLPSITLPSGRDRHGLPIGVQLVGDWGEDDKLLRVAADLEPLVA